MKKRNLVAGCLFFTWLASSAQKPEQILSSWAEQSPIEKVHVHLDRDNYLAGETVWFKAYLYSDFYPDTISTALYAELIDTSSTVLVRKIVPVFWGTAKGQIELPDSLGTGFYTLRAYTATMLNQPEDFVFTRGIFIYGKKNIHNTGNTASTHTLKFEFFPEGGNLAAGFENAVAFKATDETGLPVAVAGSLRDEKNKELTSFSSYHDGMGLFEFTPQADDKYYVQLAGDNPNKYYLPAIADRGIALSVITNSRELAFEIKQPATNPSFAASYIIGQMQHHIVFRQELAAGKQKLDGLVNTQKLNSGILQITVFTVDGIPLAERLCFIDNKEYIQEATLVIDTLSFTEKTKNQFSLVLKDTVVGSFSVAITDPSYDISSAKEVTIFSDLLLSSDLRGYVHDPAWYFVAAPDSARRAMDLVMMTNGWRRFRWEDVIKSKAPAKAYKDLSYITLAGKVNLVGGKKPFAGKDMLITINNADSTSTMQLTSTDKQGYFRVDSMFFWGNTRLLFSDVLGKKSSFIEVKMSADSLSKLFPFSVAAGIPHPVNNSVDGLPKSRMDIDYDLIQKANGVMLQGITVKGKRKKTVLEELEQKYTSGLFTAPAEHTLDLVNSNDPTPQGNIFEYLQSRVAGLTVTSPDGINYTLYYRGGRTMSLQGPVPMILFLNEMKVDAANIAALRASDISLVKVYSHFLGAEHNGAGGVLAIYTKKGADTYASSPSSVYAVNYKGYSVTKEFYSPDYKADPTEKYKADNRITLHWQPDIFINDINPKFPIVFYNNDRSKQFKVTVEGMTTTGKMVFLEKIITATEKKAF